MISTFESKTILCRYRYDPLDQLVECTPATRTAAQRFYLGNRLATEIHGLGHRTIFQHRNYLLAQQQLPSLTGASLLGADQQRSIISVLEDQRLPLIYTPYGHHQANTNASSVLAFNGERCDPVTGHYLLGNGYRAYNPTLMRFNSPDNLSPFSEGGLNPYTYCLGDPVNYSDPTGHLIAALLRTLTTTATALIGTGTSLAGSFLARAQNLHSGWDNIATASAFTSGVAAGISFSPYASLITDRIARPLAQAAFLAGSTVLARAIAPVARDVVSNVMHASQGLARAAIESDLARQLMQTTTVRRVVAYRRGFDLPDTLPTKTTARIRR
ncbi:RHS repeat-associated core domain-containing protein [Pseudomonas sp. WJP1]|uniref:RHS repeat-associated core domain-containing protein n=1 Tax=Pseudomonas sp. WJP1 TaxID=2986947 RepID=UPI002349175D|nr:RHS repeat-associated core domain-containing protein [Pseudomonas sp. WJP1]WCM51731.1 RHS repeat-associated core domain-containing protein [Pseudomonas sp. WJP1]